MTEQPTQTTSSAPAPQHPPATKALRALPPAKAPAKAKAPATAKAKAEKPAKAKPEPKAAKPSKAAAEKKPAAEKKAASPALTADVTEKRLKEIYDLEARVERAREHFESADSARKEAKGALDDALDALHEEIQAQRVGPGPLYAGTGPR